MRHPGRRISVLLALTVILTALPLAQAQYETGPPPAAVMLDENDLEQLVAPIALYPDPLLAQVLAASTYPSDIQAAASFLAANPNPPEQAIDAQPFDPSIKALMHYPSVLAMMNADIDWTQQLGIAFINQQGDVMNAIQVLRQRALSAGTLASGPQEQVYSDANGIEIVPTQENVVYVPVYDPDAIYVGAGSGAYITYSPAYPAGIWLDYDFDWHNHRFGHGGGWNHGWARHRGGPPPRLQVWERDRRKPMPVLRPGAGDAWRHIRPGYEKPGPARDEPRAFGGYQRGADVQRQDNRAQQDHGGRQPQARPQPRARPQPQQRPTEQRPAPRPQEKPAARPQEQPTARPQERPAQRPQETPAQRPQERTAPQQARPQPQARPEPQAQPQPRPRPQAPPQPQPKAEPQRQAAPSAFRSDGGGRAAAAQSSRGHASMGSGGKGRQTGHK